MSDNSWFCWSDVRRFGKSISKDWNPNRGPDVFDEEKAFRESYRAYMYLLYAWSAGPLAIDVLDTAFWHLSLPLKRILVLWGPPKTMAADEFIIGRHLART